MFAERDYWMGDKDKVFFIYPDWLVTCVQILVAKYIYAVGEEYMIFKSERRIKNDTEILEFVYQLKFFPSQEYI